MMLHAKAAWNSGLRGRSFHAVFFFGLLLLAVAWLGAAFSARQPQAVALDVGLSGVRLSLTFLALVWVQELIGKEVDKRTVFFVLAYPAPRSAYLLGRYLGILGLLALATLVLGLGLLGVVHVSSWGYQYPHELHLGWPYWATLAGYYLDVALVAALALAVASISTTNVLPLAVGAVFAVAARMLGPVFDYLAKGADGDANLVRQFDPIVSTIRWVLPDLDRLDWRLWPLVGGQPDVGVVSAALVMACAYIALMLGIAVLAFNRREFA